MWVWGCVRRGSPDIPSPGTVSQTLFGAPVRAQGPSTSGEWASRSIWQDRLTTAARTDLRVRAAFRRVLAGVDCVFTRGPAGGRIGCRPCAPAPRLPPGHCSVPLLWWIRQHRPRPSPWRSPAGVMVSNLPNYQAGHNFWGTPDAHSEPHFKVWPGALGNDTPAGRNLGKPPPPLVHCQKSDQGRVV